MKLELREFQQTAVAKLREEASWAKREARDRSKAQAVVLASPTGSGKTIITTQLIEDILNGTDEIPAEPDAVFLWLSDQPELNEQSRKKIAASSSRLRDHELVIVASSFDRRTFEGGKVYFLNTQKLGKDKNLVSKADKRQYTIWETIQNTEREIGDRFYLIIDEAHRGMNRSRQEENQNRTIAQKFVVGEAGVIEPIKLILGVSATPERFKKFLAETEATHGRTPRLVTIPPDEVRQSGLLKDQIVLFHPEADQPSDWTLLDAAAGRWVTMRDAWAAYTAEQEIAPVHPALIIQVEDGSGRILTRTDLALAIQTVEQTIGPIKDEELAHAFQDDAEITAGRHKIRKIDASRIQEETAVKIVFFKMALTTGWDCPRAEVMMSFRKAQDHTLIAQLIGRMIRTPLARRIEERELLNTVSLYLPHFNQEGVALVVDRLKNDPDTVPPTDVEDGNALVALTRRKGEGMAECFKTLDGLPTYRVDTIRKQSNTRRLMKLARLLTTLHAIDMDAVDDTKALIIGTLTRELERLRVEVPGFDEKVSGANEITVNAVTIEQGTWKELGGIQERFALNDRNIDDLFHRAGLRLGEGLEMDYWQANCDTENPQRAKLELFLTLQDQKAWENLEKACEARIHALLGKNKGAIAKLKSSEREQYNKVKELAKEPEPLDFVPPAEMIVNIGKPVFPAFDKHLYVTAEGQYFADLNTWETATIAAEIDNPQVIGWLRNYARRPWALQLPYDDGARVSPMFPDFLVVRLDGSGLVVDILEPHRSSLDDSWKKAKGLAKYAQTHSLEPGLGRIELIRLHRGVVKRLCLNDPETQKNVLGTDSNSALDLLFGVQATD
jgi:type III restriction enzyme